MHLFTIILGYITLKNVVLLYIMGCIIAFGIAYSLHSNKVISIPTITAGYYFKAALLSWYLAFVFVKSFIKGVLTSSKN